jgi:hypothetical protein
MGELRLEMANSIQGRLQLLVVLNHGVSSTISIYCSLLAAECCQATHPEHAGAKVRIWTANPSCSSTFSNLTGPTLLMKSTYDRGSLNLRRFSIGLVSGAETDVSARRFKYSRNQRASSLDRVPAGCSGTALCFGKRRLC